MRLTANKGKKSGGTSFGGKKAAPFGSVKRGGKKKK